MYVYSIEASATHVDMDSKLQALTLTTHVLPVHTSICMISGLQWHVTWILRHVISGQDQSCDGMCIIILSPHFQALYVICCSFYASLRQFDINPGISHRPWDFSHLITGALLNPCGPWWNHYDGLLKAECFRAVSMCDLKHLFVEIRLHVLCLYIHVFPRCWLTANAFHQHWSAKTDGGFTSVIILTRKVLIGMWAWANAAVVCVVFG